MHFEKGLMGLRDGSGSPHEYSIDIGDDDWAEGGGALSLHLGEYSSDNFIHGYNNRIYVII